MIGIDNIVWRSLTSLYLDSMSPGQHLAMMMATAVTIVAILVGGCWTYRHRGGSSDNSSDNLQANGNSVLHFSLSFSFLYLELLWFIFFPPFAKYNTNYFR